MAATVDYTDAVRRLVADLDRATGTLAEGFNALVELVRRADPVGRPARLRDLRDLVAGLRDRARQVAGRHAALVSLAETATAWGRVERDTGVLLDGLTDAGVGSWSGPASDRYRAAGDRQRDAVGQVRADAAAVGGYLGGVAAGTAEYLLGLVRAVTEVAGGLSRAVAADPAALDIPWLVDDLARTARGAVDRLAGAERRLAADLSTVDKMPAARCAEVREGDWPVATS